MFPAFHNAIIVVVVVDSVGATPVIHETPTLVHVIEFAPALIISKTL